MAEDAVEFDWFSRGSFAFLRLHVSREGFHRCHGRRGGGFRGDRPVGVVHAPFSLLFDDFEQTRDRARARTRRR